MTTPERRIDATTLHRVAVHGLARTACQYADPTRDGHDHEACVRDDESYAADQMLALLHTVAAGDEDAALDRLTGLLATVRHPA